MRVLLLAAANSIHTIRWANGLASRGVEVHLATAHPLTHILDHRVQLHALPHRAPYAYLLSLRALKKIITKIKPDVMNIHYATGYGLLGRLTGFKPCLLSVWGSDVYDFPEKSFFHQMVLKSNLDSATAIASTSTSMARQTSKYAPNKKIFITPFGIDENIFTPRERSFPSDAVVIGTVKTLKSKYGIDTLIRVFSEVVKRVGESPSLRLEITGDGPDLESLRDLVASLGLQNKVIFHGSVSHSQVPEMLNRLDIYVALSRLNSESFGVAIVEASACGKPVLVSDADGPAEVTIQGKTGFIVPREDIKGAADALVELIQDSDLRALMGKVGREHVIENYTWAKSLDLMIAAQTELMNMK